MARRVAVVMRVAMAVAVVVAAAGCDAPKEPTDKTPVVQRKEPEPLAPPTVVHGPALRSGLVIEQTVDAGERASLWRAMGDKSGTQHYTWRARYIRRMELAEVAAGEVKSAKLRYVEEQQDYRFERLDGDQVLGIHAMSDQHRKPAHVGIEYLVEQRPGARTLRRADGQPIGFESLYLPGELSVDLGPIQGLPTLSAGTVGLDPGLGKALVVFLRNEIVTKGDFEWPDGNPLLVQPPRVSQVGDEIQIRYEFSADTQGELAMFKFTLAFAGHVVFGTHGLPLSLEATGQLMNNVTARMGETVTKSAFDLRASWKYTPPEQ